ncbi:MAG: sulfotransferase family 2 domain-containing protein [Anaerolineae bacterium]|nr:sulfotransferase family 2 domain-containing protein [Anaerolineae bacterium]
MITPPPQTIIFLHIPKTAGTTLYHILERQYEPIEYYIVNQPKEELQHLQNLPPEQKTDIRLLGGHINFGVHAILPQPATYFTILRRPLALVTSYFYYLRSEVSHPNFHLAKSMTLPEFLESRLDENMSNIQTRLLAGKAHSGSYYECTPDDLEIAKANLRQCAVVGLTERFDETLLLLQKAFGWQNLAYARMNVTRKKPSKGDLPPDVIQAAAQANQLDEALYQYAASLFAEQVGQQDTDFARQVRAFQRQNRWSYPFRYSLWHSRRQRWLWQKNGALWLRDLYVRARNRIGGNANG